MPPESITSAGPAPEHKPRFRAGPFAVVLFFLAVFALAAIPLSAHGLQPLQVSSKEVSKQLPVAPEGARLGLPYESRPAPQRHAPQNSGGPDAFGYVFDDDGAGVTISWTQGVNRIPDNYWQRTRVLSSTDTLDDGVMTTTLPFAFNYYGTPYRQIHISTNGDVHFGVPNDWYPEQSGACLPYS